MIRIGIDAHGVGGKSLGLGNEAYFLNLIHALLDLDTENEYHVFANSPASVLGAVGHRPNLKVVSLCMRSQWIQRPISVPLYAIRRKLDLLHFPFIRPFLTGSKVVLTVHDASFKTHSECYRKIDRLRMNALVPWSCRRADLIFTVSEYAREQLCFLYGIPRDKIVVTYNSADHLLRTGKSASSAVQLRARPYVFYLGLIQPRKNIVRLIQAFDLIKSRTDLPHELILAGKMGWYGPELQQTLDSLTHRESIHFLGYVESSSGLAGLLASADLFVFPSLFECFGIPVLEAQTVGAPALVSNGSCFPEIYGDSVYYCDPLDVNSIADSIQRLLLDSALRKDLSRRGQERAKRYSWANTARIALEAYLRLADSSQNGRALV